MSVPGVERCISSPFQHPGGGVFGAAARGAGAFDDLGNQLSVKLYGADNKSS